jgi:hypothetical protein
MTSLEATSVQVGRDIVTATSAKRASKKSHTDTSQISVKRREEMGQHQDIMHLFEAQAISNTVIAGAAVAGAFLCLTAMLVWCVRSCGGVAGNALVVVEAAAQEGEDDGHDDPAAPQTEPLLLWNHHTAGAGGTSDGILHSV